jgi:hypothetical protein
MTSPKKPGVAFWTTVVVVAALVAYPLSFGPACWLGDRGVVPESIPRFVYRPQAAFLVRCCPNRVVMEMAAYGRWGSGHPKRSGFWLAQEIIKDEDKRLKGYCFTLTSPSPTFPGDRGLPARDVK